MSDPGTDPAGPDPASTDPVPPDPTGPAPHRRWAIILGVAALVLLLDQLSKAWALDRLADEPIELVWTLQLNLARNTGAAFSVGRGNDFMRFVPLAVLLVVAYLVWQSRQAMTKAGGIALGMILGGAIGNLADRALRTDGGAFFSGGVVDFIDFQWWPVFNVADMGVVCGGILLVIVSLRSERQEARAERAAADDPSAP